MSSSFNKIARDLADTLRNVNTTKPTPYDTQAEVKRIDGDIAWVHIPGGVDETPVQLTTSAKKGDTVQVRISGGRAWLYGNQTSPPTDDTVANKADKKATYAEEISQKALEMADNAERDAERAFVAANQAEYDAGRAATAAENAETSAGEAATAAENAESSAGQAAISAENAAGSASSASSSANQARASAANASRYASRALGNLSTVQSVTETLNWITQHGTMSSTTDQSLDPSHVYFVVDQSGDYVVGNTHYSIVSDPKIEDIGTYYELTIDESLNNYVATHIALTDYGLNLIFDNSSYRIHIGTLTSSGDEGVYILDENGDVISFFGESINFSSTKPQYIGGEDAFIVFDPTDGEIIIGGDVLIDGTKRLSDVLTDLDVSVTQTDSGADITINGDTVHLEDGEDAVNVVINSSNGMAFKNDSVETTLSVIIYYGSKTITNQTGLLNAFGSGTYLQWKAKLYGESTYSVIPSSDPRLSNDGFVFHLSPSDVNVQAVFNVEIIAPD